MTKNPCAALLVLLPVLAACGESAPGPTVPGADAGRGKLLVRGFGCGTCHTLPDIPQADSLVGPPLGEYWRQGYIAGVLPNQPEALVRWLMDPPAVDPLTAMPDMDISEVDARDIAAYLYSRDNR